LRLGVKASVRDIDRMAELDVDFVETFLGPKDLKGELKGLAEAFEAPGYPIVIHVPEFHGDVFVDLATYHERSWKESFEAVRRCVELADRVGARHIVLHPGGASEKDLEKAPALRRLRMAIQELSYDRFYLENMPWFYFQAREKRVRSHLMVDVADYEEVIDVIGGITVDTCHSYLSDEGGSMENLLALMDSHPAKDKYYHISDALPPDEEGLQIGTGDIDFGPVFDRLRGKDAWAIPEIMGGHKDGGTAFSEALDILRQAGL
jgi:N-acetylneuraminate synthase